MRQYVKIKLEKAIDKVIYDLHQEYDTKSGDITPELQNELEETIEKLSFIIHQQIQDNL
jgi:hypothetical protein